MAKKESLEEATRRANEFNAKLVESGLSSVEPVEQSTTEVSGTADFVVAQERPNLPVSRVATLEDGRRPRGWLESDVKRITDAYITGELKTETGDLLTPYRVSQFIKKLESLEKGPSTGAIAAVFERWKDIGFAEISDKPLAFVDYTDVGRELGLRGIKEKRAQNRRDARAAAKSVNSDQ